MRRSLLVLALLLALPAAARADEGMFLLHEVEKAALPAMQARGLKLSAADVQGLAPAIVQLAQGGTGSFVSADGLIVTNHHVAYRCLAVLDATTHRGLMDRGYVASSRGQELPCPGYDALVVVEVKDVTAEVLRAATPRMRPDQRFLALMVARRTMEATCEKQGVGRVCEVSELNGGAGFVRSIYRRVRDVRLVYAPPRSLGKFGGDIDNWRYPRHTADFTFLRAYLGADGTPATYRAGNLPFKPARFLKVATDGIRRGALTMVLGFPGSTARHVPASRAEHYLRHLAPTRARILRDLISVLPRTGLDGRRYQGLEAGLQNSAKYYEDSVAGFEKLGVLDAARRRDAELAARIAASPELKRRHGDLLARIAGIYGGLAAIGEKSQLLAMLRSRFVRSLATAFDLVRWSRVRGTPDLRREGESYRDKNLFRMYEASDELEAKLTTGPGERILATRLLGSLAALKGLQTSTTATWLRKLGERELSTLRRLAVASKRPFADVWADASQKAPPTDDPVAAAVALIYARTAIFHLDVEDAKSVAATRAVRQRLFKATTTQLRASRDPLVQLAVQLEEEVDRFEKGPLRPAEKVLAPILLPSLVKDVIRPAYWDANFTLRLSHGTVEDYTESATGKRWPYVSRLSMLLRKVTGKDPFEAPPRLRAAARAGAAGRWSDPVVKDVPVNFTSTLDTTGGNSGSPVLNARGELVGLLFDGTPESILSDWHFDEKYQRSICVDMRFVLFLAEQVDGAHALMKELGLARP